MAGHAALLDGETEDVVAESFPVLGEFEEEVSDEEIAMNLDSLADLFVEEKRQEPPTGFVISITRGGKCRRLHFAGGCLRIPGEHYGKFDDYGQVVSPESAYGHR